MECRELEITLISAQNLENVRQFFKNRVRVYAKISLGGNSRTEKRTPVDKEGQTNPVWNFTAVYTVGKNAVKSQDIKLLIQFFCVRTSQETNIGEVSVSLAELFDRFSALPEGEGAAKVNYPVKRADADSQGEVSLSYKFGDLFDFVPPPTNWGKVCWKGTKLIFKGGMLCARLALLAGGNVLDMPIDGVVDVAYTSYDILSCVFGAGDFLADIPLGEADLLADISCPGTDVSVVIDTSSSLQSNEFAGRNLAADDLSIPSAGIQDPVEVPFLGEDVPMAIDATACQVPMDVSGAVNATVWEGSTVADNSANACVHTATDATSVAQTDAFGGSNVQADATNLYAESNNVSDSTSAAENFLVDALCSMDVPTDGVDVLAVSNTLPDVLYMPLGEADLPVDISCPAADIPLAEDAASNLQTHVDGELINVPSDSIDVPTDGLDVLAKSSMLPDVLYMPWGETDLLVDVSCHPGADIPLAEDFSSSLQTNMDEGLNIPAIGTITPIDSIDVLAESSMMPDILYMPLGETDSLDFSRPGADIPTVEDATSSLQTNAYEGSNMPASSTHAPVDGIHVLAESNMLLDVLCIPLGEADFQPVDISCPAADIPLTEDAPLSLQTNVYGGSNVANDSTSVPSDSANAYLHLATDSTPTVQKDAFGGSNLRAESNNMSTDTTSAETDLLVDVPCSILPTARRDARDDATSSVETNASAADVPFSEGDHVPTAVDATSHEASMHPTFSTDTNETGDISCLKSNAVVEVTSGDETNAGSDVSFLDEDIGKTNLMADIPCLEADGLKDATFIIGEMTSETSCLQGDIQAGDASDGETNKTDDVSSIEGDVEEDVIVDGETMEDIPCLEGDVEEDITCLEEEVEADGVTNKTDDVSRLEGDVEEDASETMEEISCLEEDVEEDSLCLEEEAEVDGTVIVRSMRLTIF